MFFIFATQKNDESIEIKPKKVFLFSLLNFMVKGFKIKVCIKDYVISFDITTYIAKSAI